MKITIITGMIAALIFGLFTAMGYSQKKEGLVLYLPFEEGSGNKVHDQSGHGWEGEFNGAKWVDGKIGKALEFSGTGLDCVVVDAPVIDSVGKTNEITIEAWFYLLSHQQYDGIVSIATRCPGEFCCSYRIMVDPSYHPFFNCGHHVDRKITDFTFKEKTWYHYAMTYDGSTARIYVNGKQIGEQAENVKPLPKAKPVLVGTGEAPGTWGTNAIIDEVAIYDRCLGEDEIKQDMKGVILSVDPNSKLTTAWGYIKYNLRR
ncbi:LamG domain-containing protein [Candidatus Poribacteria bacterium]|nr:LamG domain-containing protein [Candidatus Poribacteria bacterium]